jgi:hypothetical protein
MIKKIVEGFLLHTDNSALSRREYIEFLLRERDIDFSIMTPTKNAPVYLEDTSNIVVSFNKEIRPRIVLGAHYDIVPKSIGINDNTVAVATLIDILPKLKDTKLPLDVVFFDKEEAGMHGSALYIEQTGKENIKEAFILDVIGFGDTLVFSGPLASDYLAKFDGFNNIKLGSELPSDNIVFGRQSIPAALLVAAPKEDIKKVEIAGHDPFYTMTYRAMFYESFHNRSLDNDINIINWNLVERIADKLVELYG